MGTYVIGISNSITESHCVAQAGLELVVLPFISQMLGLQTIDINHAQLEDHGPRTCTVEDH